MARPYPKTSVTASQSHRSKDLTGYRFGRLTVLRRDGNRVKKYKDTTKKGDIIWLCQCDCGNESRVTTGDIRSNNVNSCGCLRRELLTKHNESTSRTYGIWKTMKQRCENQKNTSYYNYGGRGIAICDRWRVFDNFLADMGHAPADYSIERIDYNGNYCPENCKWIPRREQPRNTRQNHVITFNGKTQILADWAREYGLAFKKLRDRITRGWPIEQALGIIPRS